MVFEKDENQEGFEETPKSYLRQKSRRSWSGRKVLRISLIAAAVVVLVAAGIMVFLPGGDRSSQEVSNKKTLEIGDAGSLPEAPSQKNAGPGSDGETGSEAIMRLESVLSDMETQIDENHEQLMGRVAELARRVVENNEHARESLKKMDDLEARIEKLEGRYQLAGDGKTAESENEKTAKSENGKKAEAEKEEPEEQYYTVKKNDTIYSIAKDHGIELETFLEINGFNRDSKIYPGQKLKVSP